MNAAIDLNGSILGSYLPTATPYMNTQSTLPTYDSTSNPIGAGTDGSWVFNQTVINQQGKHIRTNPATYDNQKVWDGLYGFGLWIKFNSIPVGTSTAQYNLYQTARVSSFPGFGISIRGTAHTSGPALMHNLFNSTTPILTNPQVDTWYYIVGRKSSNTVNNRAEIWVNGVRVAVGTNRTFVNPVGPTTDTAPYQITFGDTTVRTTANAFSYNISHAHLMDSTTFTDAAIAEIYQAGITAPSVRTVKYYDGTAWQTSSAQKVYNGTAWVDWNAKRFDGSAWVNV